MISLETRAEIIADGAGGRTRGTSNWKLLRARALKELEQACDEAVAVRATGEKPPAPKVEEVAAAIEGIELFDNQNIPAIEIARVAIAAMCAPRDGLMGGR